MKIRTEQEKEEAVLKAGLRLYKKYLDWNDELENLILVMVLGATDDEPTYDKVCRYLSLMSAMRDELYLHFDIPESELFGLAVQRANQAQWLFENGVWT